MYKQNPKLSTHLIFYFSSFLCVLQSERKNTLKLETKKGKKGT